MQHPSPGSEAALSKGCTCPVTDNSRGAGMPYKGETLFWLSDDCPLHGVGSERKETT